MEDNMRRKLLTLVIIVLGLAAPAMFAAFAPVRPGRAARPVQSSAAISTDKSSYVAGEPVEISGSGFSPFERVMLQVQHPNGTTESGEGHEAWFVDAAGDGSFTTTWSISSTDDVGTNLVLNAAGSARSSAQAEFARAASLRLNRPFFKPGEIIDITGSGFNPNERVTVQVNERDAVSTLSNGNGEIETSLQMPEILIARSFSVRAIEGETSLATPETFIGVAAADASTTFQLDGDAAATYPAAATGHDWSQVYSDFKKTTVNDSGTGAINFFNDSIGTPVTGVGTLVEDTFSGGQSKDTNDMNQWSYNSSAPQNKANLENAFGAAYFDVSNNQTYLYVGADRWDNSGSIALGVWFLQSPVGTSGGKFYTLKSDGTPDTTKPAHHTNGDLLLVANFNSGVATITSFTWNNGTIPATGTTLDPGVGLAVVNTVPLDGATGHPPAVPWPYKSSASGAAANYVQAGEFFEAFVNLNLLFPTQTSFNYSSFIVETRSSTSPTSTLSDFIVGHVSTAPDIGVTKVADSESADTGSQVGYTVTVTNDGVGDIFNASLSDPLPAGVLWSIDGAAGNFVLTGALNSQTLSLTPNLTIPNNAPAQSVHIVGTPSAPGTLTNTATVSAANEDPAFSSNNQRTATITVVNSGIVPVSPQSSVEAASHAFQMGTFTSGFSGTASVDVNWGDGTAHTVFPFANTPVGGTNSMPDQTHTYAVAGTYTVTETGTLAGSTKTAHFTANVSDLAPIITMKIGAITLNAGDGFTRPGSFSDPGPAGETWTITVDYGDGTVEGPTTVSPGSFTIGHTYSSTGAKTVTVTITGSNSAYGGGTGTKTFTVNVNP
jgi:uncharacterized repeat protein (TIGR01451 family)